MEKLIYEKRDIYWGRQLHFRINQVSSGGDVCVYLRDTDSETSILFDDIEDLKQLSDSLTKYLKKHGRS